MSRSILSRTALVFSTVTLVCIFAYPVEAQKADRTVNRWLDRMDANEDGAISVDEWRGGAPFARLDRDGNGKANREELLEFWKWRNKKRAKKGKRQKARARLHSRFPNARFHTPTGQKVDLKDLRGRVVALLPFATWCPPCVRKLPEYIRVYRQYENSKKVTVIIYNYKEHYETTASHIKYNGGENVTVLNAGKTGDEGAPGGLNNPTGRTIKLPGSMPQAWLIDQSGIVAQERTSRAGRAGFANAQRFCGDIERLVRKLPIQSDWNSSLDYDWKKWSKC